MPALFFAVWLACLGLYWPALHGPFVLDDLPNFYGLRFVDSFSSALNYALQGETGIRYLSYLSFTLHAGNFVSHDAFPFKLLNLLLHGSNALLLYRLMTQLLARHPGVPGFSLPALAIATTWLIHPIHAGTVLYSVQRMNLLATFFVLAGCLYHLHFLARHPAAQTTRQWLLYTGTLWGITGLGVISKENAILLPAFVALITNLLPERPFRAWQRGITFYTPLLALLVLLIVDNRLQYGWRDFTMGERLLSEVVILQEYATKIIIPDISAFSLFYDDFAAVRSLHDPRLILALTFWSGVIILGFALEPFSPGFRFGIAWFLAGHLLESTIIPLELYFDHRNYLPAAGLIFSATVLLQQLPRLSPQRPLAGWLAITLAGILLANLLWLLQQETSFWQDEYRLANSLHEKHPDSRRALEFLGEAQFRAGDLAGSLATVKQIHHQFGAKPSSVIHEITLSCLANPLIIIHTERIATDFRSMPYDSVATPAMQNLFALVKSGRCPALGWDSYRMMANALLRQARDDKQTYNMTYLIALSHVEEKQYKVALEASMTMPQQLRNVRYRLFQIDLALKSRDRTQALYLFNELQAMDSPDKLFYKKELMQLARFMKELRHDQ